MAGGSLISKWFALDEHGTTVPRELRAGLVTFLTLGYIMIANPAILSQGGFPKEAATTATILTVVFATALMGLFAKRPFAVAPLMGENAFVAISVCVVLGYTWQTALAGILISSGLVTILSLTGARKFLMEAIPINLKYALAVAIGLYLTFIGLNFAGIVTLGVEGAPVHLGKVHTPEVLVALAGLVVLILLIVKRIPGAILLGILITTALAFAAGVAKMPDRIVSLPPSIEPTLFKFDFSQVFTAGFLPVLLTLFLLDFLDMMGSLIACSSLAGFLDEKGNLPHAQRPLFVDSIASVFGACVGTTTSGTYIESAAGIQEGGRTGLTALTVAVLFALSLFFAPFLAAVPPQAYGPALVLVGMLMLCPITKIDFNDYTEFIPAFMIIAMMSFTYNLGVGMIVGFALYPLGKIVTRRTKEVPAGMWILFVLSLLFFVFYKY
jgi:AGZA family xanthine/uracil permease-like MFS transporter